MSRSGVRDVRDAQEYSAQYFAGRKAMREANGPPQVGAGGSCTPRSTSLARTGPGGKGGPCDTDPGCDYPSECGGTILGFHSFNVAGFPFPGVAAGTLLAMPEIGVNSGKECNYKARQMFWEGRDALNGFVVVPTMLSSAVIAGRQQLASTAVANAITSSVFALTCTPLPINWEAFQNTEQLNLTLTFQTYLGAVSSIEMLGVFWGDGTGTR